MKTATIKIPDEHTIDSVDKQTGKVTFKKVHLKSYEKIKTLDDALKACNLTLEEVQVSGGIPEDRESIQNYTYAIIISRALNDGWTPNWDDSSEYKYYPWFKMSASGFSYDGYDCWNTFSSVGSRLCFKNRELAIYAGKQFKEVYQKFMVT